MTVSKPTMIKKFHSVSKYHRPTTKRSKTTKIAWHYTGQAEVPAINTWRYFENNKVYASAHFIVGLDGEIYYSVPMDEIAYTTNEANKYSIGIECATTGSNDHYSDKEYVAMVKLGAWLCQEYDLDPRNDFIRHYDVTKKQCPRYFVNNPKMWTQFKLDCYNYMMGNISEKDIKNCSRGQITVVPPKSFKVQVLSETLNVRKVADWDAEPITQVKKGQWLVVVDTVTAKNGSTKMYKLESGLYITSSEKYVKKV